MVVVSSLGGDWWWEWLKVDKNGGGLRWKSSMVKRILGGNGSSTERFEGYR